MQNSDVLKEQRQKLVDDIVETMLSNEEMGIQDAGMWMKNYTAHLPRRLIQGKDGNDVLYHGGNRIRLMVAAMMRKFDDSRWATYNQVELMDKQLKKQGNEDGCHVKKGAKGTVLEYWKEMPVQRKEVNPATGEKEPVFKIDPETGERKPVMDKRLKFLRTFTVFNANQIDGIEKEEWREIPEAEKNIYFENMMKNSEAEIFEDQMDRNYYQPRYDEIHLVPRNRFDCLDNFYATATHEVAHSTGAASRLNRAGVVNSDGFGGTVYAQEELRAELASVFLNSEYGISFSKEHFTNQSRYVRNWATVLKNDPDEIFKAANDAEKAVAYIKENMLEKGLDKFADKFSAVSCPVSAEVEKDMAEIVEKRKKKSKSAYKKSTKKKSTSKAH